MKKREFERNEKERDDIAREMDNVRDEMRARRDIEAKTETRK